jgi:hypothetical protein
MKSPRIFGRYGDLRLDHLQITDCRLRRIISFSIRFHTTPDSEMNVGDIERFGIQTNRLSRS